MHLNVNSRYLRCIQIALCMILNPMTYVVDSVCDNKSHTCTLQAECIQGLYDVTTAIFICCSMHCPCELFLQFSLDGHTQSRIKGRQ